jgi:hypothetical protein
MTAIFILIMIIILPIVSKEYLIWFKTNSLKLVFMLSVCAFIDLYIIYKLLTIILK